MHTSTLISAFLTGLAAAETHSMYAGFFGGTNLVRLEFDDATDTLSLAENISAPYTTGQKWIALNPSKNNLYVATIGGFQSYSIESNLSLTYQSNVTTSSDCPNGNHIAVSGVSPNTVFGITYSTACPSLAISVDTNGAFQSVWAEVAYSESDSSVHGGSVSPDGEFLYSADDPGNSVYVHTIDTTAGTVEQIQHLVAPEGSDPRHLTVHPNGKWVYVLYEGSGHVAVYSRDNATGLLTDTNTTYSLLPEGFTNSSSYWADEVIFSSLTSDAPKYLFAATRSYTLTLPGYVSAFSLDADTGAIAKQLFILPTTGSGGSANSVGPTTFSEEYFTMPDSQDSFVEMWKISAEGTSAAVVAHLDLEEGPANVVML